MKFHWPSFVIGYGAGAGTVMFAKHLRPLMLEVATAGYRFFDAIAARTAMKQEDVEDLFAEARAKARGQRQETRH